jgi:phosphate:Na+ symporter
MLLGLGLLFYGMNLMGDATLPLRSYQPFVDLLARMDNPYIAVLISAGFTAVIQSSSATTAVIIVLASQGLISLEQGIPLVFGANIGTCVTALLATIRKQRPALRAALIHVLFNVLGVLIWFGFIDELAELARWISPAGGELTGAARVAAVAPRQIANAHTLFNVGNTMIFIWFTGAFAWLVTKLVPEKRLTGPGAIEPRFLDRGLIGTPALALDATRMEIVRMAGHVVPMVKQAAPAVLSGAAADLDHIQDLDKEVDILHRAIVRYLGKVSQEILTAAETESLHDYLGAATLYENIGDTVKTDLVHTGRERLLRNVRVSPGTEVMFASLTEKVVWALETATDAVDRKDPSLARQVIDAKEEVNRIADRISERLVQRLIAEDPHRTSTFHIESQLIEHFKRIYYSAKRVAKLVAEFEVIDGRARNPHPDHELTQND